MTSLLYTEESSSETAMEGSLAVSWAEMIEPENTPIEIKLSKNRKINLFNVFIKFRSLLFARIYFRTFIIFRVFNDSCIYKSIFMFDIQIIALTIFSLYIKRITAVRFIKNNSAIIVIAWSWRTWLKDKAQRKGEQ